MDISTENDSGLLALDLKMWRLQKLEAQAEDIKRLVDIEISRIKFWHAAQTAELDEQIASLTAELVAYHESELEVNPKATTISLPHGKLVSSESAARVEVEDLERLIKWAKATDHTDLIRVKEEADLLALRKAVWQDGVEAEGVIKIPKTRKFAIKPAISDDAR